MKNTIRMQIISWLMGKPAGYIITAGNIMHDLCYNTPTHDHDDEVCFEVREICKKNLMKDHGVQLVKQSTSRSFSRNGNRAANVYRLEVIT
jgi:hypothetical protein